jgi:hypothetical protein
MFVELDSKVEIAPKVIVSPFLEKKKENLKFARFFKGAMVVRKHIVNQLI